MRITRLHLCVPDLDQLEYFYSGLLGMRSIEKQNECLFGYTEQQCVIEFSKGVERFAAFSEQDFYWKTGIVVKNLRLAVDYIRSLDWAVSEPRQFRDIGFLCHLKDPNGLPVELLQQGFEGNELPAGSGHPIGGQATFAHITLRVNNILAARKYFENGLGMRLMSVQPVPEYNFTLYFYAWSEERLPNPELTDPGNREWLWARPYTMIEIQHLENECKKVAWPNGGNSVFSGFSWLPGEGQCARRVTLSELCENLHH